MASRPGMIKDTSPILPMPPTERNGLFRATEGITLALLFHYKKSFLSERRLILQVGGPVVWNITFYQTYKTRHKSY